MYIMSISSTYPESYWLNYEGLLTNNYFNQGKLVENHEVDSFNYHMDNKISIKQFLKYDVLYSNGPILISPRLTNILKNKSTISKEIQLIEANLYLHGELYEGYNILNILYLEECIDLNYSVSEAILDYIEDGPRYFSKIILKDKILMHSIVRAAEAPYLIVVNKELKDLLASFAINGISFLKEL